MWHSVLDNHQKVGCVFLDLKKAFDSVPHQALLNKLHSLHLPIHLFSWFSNYLKQRLQRVVLHGCTSPWLPVVSGVPQGSILGPILFLLYINGIFNVQLSKGSTLLVYADDILLFKPLSSPSDIQELQDDVDRICEWISLNHLTINVAKSKSMCITRRRSSMLSFTILVNGSPLEKVKCFKYLGLWITDDLTWSCHIESVCCRARQQLGFIYRFFSPHCDAGTILALYKAHVLPMLDYACIVWDPHLRKDQLLLESVQHFALKIASQTWNSDYQTLRTRYDLAPLVNRRSYFKLLATFKFVHGFLYCPGGYFLYKHSPNLRISHTKQLMQPFARCNAFYHSFFVSSVKLWNSLPAELVLCSSIGSFKSKLRLLYTC